MLGSEGLLGRLRQDRELAEALRLHADFNSLDPDLGRYLELVPPPLREALTPLGRGAAGGCFFLWACQGERPVVCVSSEGEAGRFARDFGECLSVLSALGDAWHDVWAGIRENESSLDLLQARLEHGLDRRLDQIDWAKSSLWPWLRGRRSPRERVHDRRVLRCMRAPRLLKKRLGVRPSRRPIRALQRALRAEPSFVLE